MDHKKTPKPEPKAFIPAIDPDILARINAKIAKAHEQNESPYVYHKSKKPVAPKPI